MLLVSKRQVTRLDDEAITQPIPGVFRIPIRIDAPSGRIFAHAIALGDRWIVVDLGRNDALARESWVRAEEALDLSPGRVAYVILTHYHADHVGLAAWAAERWQTAIRMLPGEQAMAYRLYHDPRRQLELDRFYRGLGVPPDRLEAIIAGFEREAREVKLPPRMERLTPNQRIALDRTTCRILAQGGHTDEHALIHFPDQGVLISGDQILPRITPNIGYLPGGDPNPLGSYLEALDEIRDLAPRRCLPSHESEVDNVLERIAEIRQHHQRRLDALMERLGDGATVFEMAERLFGDPMTPFQWRFALGETTAHLEYLLGQHRVASVPGANPIRYLPLKTGTVF